MFIKNDCRHFFAVFLLPVLLFICGCSGESGPTIVYPIPVPVDLRITGNINLSDVAVNPALGGITPSLLDLRPFTLYIEDDPAQKKIAAAEDGRFAFAPVAICEQLVIYCRHATHKGLVLEYMLADSKGLYGEKQIEINIRSTAQSMIARCLRERYGRRINPQALEAKHIDKTVRAITDVLEKYPEKIAAVSLDQVEEVRSAYGEMAATLHAGGSGVYPDHLVLLFYMGADNSLASQMADGIEAMAAAGVPSGTRVIVQADFPVDGMKRMMLVGNKFVELGSAGKVDSSSGAIIADLIAWSRRTFPASRYMLAISSHADGWRSQARTRRSLIADDDAGKNGNPVEIAGWLNAAGTIFDGFRRPLDLLVLDACSLGNIEIAYEFKDCAHYTVFSQANVPAAGFPMDSILRRLDATGVEKCDNKAVGVLFCDEYRKKYIDAAVKIPATVSLIRNSAFVAFMPVLKNYLEQVYAHRAAYAGVLANLRDSLEVVAEGASPSYVIQAFARAENRDLYHLVTQARNIMPAVAIQTDLLVAAFPSLVELNYRSGYYYPGAHGISIVLPDKNTYLNEYAGLSPASYFLYGFCRETLWDELLQAINSP